MPETVEGDRFIVTGESRGCFFPRLERETSFIREFDGRTAAGPFRMAGSVYGRQLQFRGPGECDGIVVGRGDLRLDASRPGERQVFRGSVSASGSVQTLAPAQPLRRTLVGDIRQASVLIRGDVVGDHVHLCNTVVVGNVHGTNVRLTNCVVFGAVVAQERATLQASTLLYYHGREVTFEGPCMMLHAMGESPRSPVFAPFEDAAGEIHAADVRYYPALQAQGIGGLCHRPWDLPPGSDQSRLVPQADWVMVLAGAGDQPQDAGGERIMLSIAGRAMNMAALQVVVDRMARLLCLTFEYDHYPERVRLEAAASILALASEEEAWVFSTLLRLPGRGAGA